LPSERFANDVRLLRFLAADMSQAELGQRARLTRQTIAAIEQGRYWPSLEAAFRIAHVFGKRVDDVFHYTPDVETVASGPSPSDGAAGT